MGQRPMVGGTAFSRRTPPDTLLNPESRRACSLNPRPQTIQIFLPHGDPTGIRIAEITTRTVRAVEIPRKLLSRFLEMPESTQVGLYFLFGSEDDESSPSMYIGQTGALKDRLYTHQGTRDSWNRAVAVLSLTNAFTSTHVGYLEWHSIQEARKAARFRLENVNGGSRPHTPPPLEADCQEIHETASVLLATLGYTPFKPLADRSQATELLCKGPDTEAKGLYGSEGMVVLKGSVGRREVVASFGAASRAVREQLLDEKVIIEDGRNIRFTQDHQFRSPSAASGCLLGRPSNGWDDWKSADGRSLDELERRASLQLAKDN